MFSLASPVWLSALLLIPLVWWLHRFRERGRRFPVAALFLWDAAREEASAGDLTRRPEPIWLLRAALVGLLAVALAGPRLTLEEPTRVILWIDDSVSMHSLDGLGTSRLQRGWNRARLELAARDTAGIVLRSLSRPGSVELGGRQTPPRDLPGPWIAQAPAEPAPPPPLQMDPEAEHWLLSDGNSAGLVQWIRRAPLSRVLQVEGSRSNAGITGLSLRRFPKDRSRGRVMVTVKNAGTEAVERVLELALGEEPLQRERIRLAPGEEVSRQADLAEVHGGELRARLSPADALKLDDELVLDATAVAARPTSVIGDCGPYLPAALSTHPWLEPGRGADGAALKVYCSAEPGSLEGPAIVLRADGLSAPVRGALRWHPAAGALTGLALPAGSVSAHRALTDDAGALPLLSENEKNLISHQPARQRLTVALDLAEPALARRPEYPLLILGLVDTVLGQDLSSGAVSLHRLPQLVDIEPRPLPEARSGVRLASRQRQLSGILTAAALLVLALDLLRLFWRRSRQSRQLQRWQARYER